MPHSQNEWTELVGDYKATDVLKLTSLNHIEKLAVTKAPRLKPKLASTFTKLNSSPYPQHKKPDIF
jgi:hypothetical protein